jgi:hypothetical protein
VIVAIIVCDIEQCLLSTAITHVTYARLFRIKCEFDVELDLYCDWYFTCVTLKHVVTCDAQVEVAFPSFSML